ncbi:MAG: ACP phosphodiesterase [Flavobacteriales bacterium]
MNYLAHLVLSQMNSELMLGNFIGDAVKGNPTLQYNESIAKGIYLHRWIDSYADSHPIGKETRGLLRPHLGRFSGVGVDLLFDHFLSKNFHELVPEMELGQFIKYALSELNSRQGIMPVRSKNFFHAMKAHDWLRGYGDRKAMLGVCRSMDVRLQERLGVESTLHQLFDAADAAGYNFLQGRFEKFWKDIRCANPAIEFLDTLHKAEV